MVQCRCRCRIAGDHDLTHPCGHEVPSEQLRSGPDLIEGSLSVRSERVVCNVDEVGPWRAIAYTTEHRGTSDSRVEYCYLRHVETTER